MGFETVTGSGDAIALNKMQDGESIVVYLKDVVPEMNVKFNTPTVNFIAIRPENGAEVKLLSGGNASYVAKNIAAKLGKLPANPQFAASMERDAQLLGYLCKITKVGKYTQKKTGKEVTTFTFARDPEKPLSAYKAPEQAAATGIDAIDFPPF